MDKYWIERYIKTIIPLALVRYNIVKANPAQSVSFVIYHPISEAHVE